MKKFWGVIVLCTIVRAATPEPATSAAAAAGMPNADSLEYIIRRDYRICTGDTTDAPRAKVFAWKARIDSLILTDKNYGDKFNSFVRTTGIKAHEVRPCEPIAFHERVERQLREMDSIVNAVRRRNERERADSALLAAESAVLKAGPADIFGVPAGMSRNAVRLTLARGRNIKTRNVQGALLIDTVKMFDSVTVTVALRFGADGKYTGYEIETAAVKAELLDPTVRAWAALFVSDYQKRLGAPNAAPRVGFHDIKQGRLSMIARWDKDAEKNRPRTAVGLATHANLYYAKVVVKY